MPSSDADVSEICQPDSHTLSPQNLARTRRWRRRAPPFFRSHPRPPFCHLYLSTFAKLFCRLRPLACPR
eukprot:6173967-Pleurochrysis_carterae.AAC.2